MAFLPQPPLLIYLTQRHCDCPCTLILQIWQLLFYYSLWGVGVAELSLLIVGHGWAAHCLPKATG
jgi:hypothetical protein